MKLFDILPRNEEGEFYRSDDYFVEFDKVDVDEHGEPEYHFVKIDYYGHLNPDCQIMIHNVEMHRIQRQTINYNGGSSPVDYKSEWFEVKRHRTGEKYKIRVLCYGYNIPFTEKS